MYLITETYHEVKRQSSKKGKCGCGKYRTRSRTFSQTINPFNKKDGRLKTELEIREELVEEVREWQKEPITCEDCYKK